MEKNRIIKFRGKDKNTGEWRYGGLVIIPAPPQCFSNTEPKDEYWICYPDPKYMPDWGLPYKMVRAEVITETIGQYTGLKDKNGKKIYEGDIIKVYINDFRTTYCTVNWADVVAQFQLWQINTLEGTATTVNIADYKLEVIGNIYDNKELLGE